MVKIIKYILAIMVPASLIGGGIFIAVMAKNIQVQKPVLNIQNAEKATDIAPVAIIGSGPAAYSAALYAARAHNSPVVITGNKIGGALTETSYIENFPGRSKVLGTQLMSDMQEQAASFGAKFLQDTIDKVDFSVWPYVLHTEGGKTIHALSVIIATGSTPRRLGLDSEQKYWGKSKGVSTCATCDAPYHEGNNVVVIGGGDSAMEEASQLAKFAKKVTLVVRKDHLKASAIMQDRLQEYPNIEVCYNSEVRDIKGNDTDVTHVELYNNKTDETTSLEVQGVFLAIGHTPNTELFKNFIEIDEQGYITMDGRTQKTSLPGVFAAGDVEDHDYKQAVVAAGRGSIAALDSERFLRDVGFSTAMAEQLKTRFFDGFKDETLKISLIKTIGEFDDMAKDTGKALCIDFYAPYCPSCMGMLPAVESVAYQYSNQANFVKVDLTQSSELAKKLNISKVPCFIVMKEGQEVGRQDSAMSKKELYDFVGKFVEYSKV